MENLRVSLAQINIRLGDPDANLSKAVAWIEQAANQNCQVILFPELWNSGYDLPDAARYARKNIGIRAALQKLSSRFQIHIIGSLIEEINGSFYNTLCWHTPDASSPVCYRKTHLFRLMKEEQWLKPGNELVSSDAPWGKTGLAVCYDLRFPELFRSYAFAGAEFLIVSAEWPLKRVTHWNLLLRARAIENQCFMLACNAAGTIGKDVYAGHSAIIDPWGETIVEGGEDEELLVADLDLRRIAEVRAKIPVFQDRRPDLY